MHNNWEEMLPFYIAGTLPKNDTKRLENHLSRCDECRSSLAEWHRIADAVRADAASQMRDLPPLSSHVLSLASQQAEARYNQPVVFPFTRQAARSRFRSATVTLVAAAFTVLLLGGVLALLVLGGALPFRIATPDAGVVLLATETETPTESVTNTPIPSQTNVPPSATTVPSQTTVPETVTPIPSVTPVPPSATTMPSQTSVPPSATLVPSQTSVPPSATTMPSQTSVPPSATLVPSQTSVPPSLTPMPPTATTVPSQTRVPPTAIPPSATPQPQIIVIEPSATPVTPTPIIPTRVPPTEFIPPTDTLPPTEALLLPDGTQEMQLFSMQALVPNATCAIQGAAAGVAIDLHAGPGDEYAVINSFTQEVELTALALSDNGWIRVQYAFDGMAEWVGWVLADQVFQSGECADLPLIAAAEATDDVLPSPETTEEASVEATTEIEATDEALPTSNPLPDSDAPAVVISAAVANLRAGPGTSYAIVGTARSGDRLPVIAQTTTASGVWYRVQASSGLVWIAASIVRLTPSGAFVPPAPTLTPSPTAETVEPLPTDEIASGSWSQTVTVLSASCDGAPAAGGTVPVSLLVAGDLITVFAADAGSPYTVSRVGEQTYSGGYTTASATVSVSLTFASPTSYYGSAVATTAEGCVAQSALSGVYGG